MKVFNFKKEIARLEDQKWQILLSRGQHVAVEAWKPIDAKLEKLYRWVMREASEVGEEVKLPFHRRKLK